MAAWSDPVKSQSMQGAFSPHVKQSNASLDIRFLVSVPVVLGFILGVPCVCLPAQVSPPGIVLWPSPDSASMSPGVTMARSPLAFPPIFLYVRPIISRAGCPDACHC